MDIEKDSDSLVQKVEFVEAVAEARDEMEDEEHPYGKVTMDKLPSPETLARSGELERIFRDDVNKFIGNYVPAKSREEVALAKLNPSKATLSKGNREMLSILQKHLPTHELVNALASQSLDNRFHRLLLMVVNPRYADLSLPILCMRCGVKFMDLVSAVKELKLGESILRMLLHAPEVIEDVTQDAKSVPIPCPHCSVKGKSEGCKFCHKTGIKMVPGDSAARRLLFETFGLTGQAPMNATQVNVNVGGESLEETIKGATITIGKKDGTS
jgi:hypothetical protein